MFTLFSLQAFIHSFDVSVLLGCRETKYFYSQQVFPQLNGSPLLPLQTVTSDSKAHGCEAMKAFNCYTQCQQLWGQVV